jgi:hypothetical protein
VRSQPESDLGGRGCIAGLGTRWEQASTGVGSKPQPGDRMSDEEQRMR